MGSSPAHGTNLAVIYPSRCLALCLSLPFCKIGLKETMRKNPSTLRFSRSVIPRALITARDSPFLGGRAGAAKAAGMGAGSPSTASFGALGQSRVPGTRIRPVFQQRASYFPPHFLFSPFGAPPLPLRDWPALRGSRSTRRLASHQRFPERRPRGGTESGPARGEEERRQARGRQEAALGPSAAGWSAQEGTAWVLQLGTMPGALGRCVPGYTHRLTLALIATSWSHNRGRLFFPALCI